MRNHPPATPTSKQINELRKAICEDLDLLAYLHAGELDQQSLDHLRSLPFASHLGIVLTSKRSLEALAVLDQGLSVSTEKAQLEELACDYTGIYLTHQCAVSPNESPWLDDDHLECQQPMFEVREWYEHYGMKAKDWRKRPDDHLATQLAFAAHLMRNPEIELVELARFLDQHLLKWLPDFAQKVAGRCATPFYAGLSMLTSAYLDELRGMIEAITGEARPEPEENKPTAPRLAYGEDVKGPFVPPTDLDGPGW